MHLFQTVSLKSHTQAESASSVICASVLLNFAGYTSRSSHTPSSLLPIAPLVHPDKSGLSIQHHVEVGLSCRETLTFSGFAWPCRTVMSHRLVDIYIYIYLDDVTLHCLQSQVHLLKKPCISIRALFYLRL